MIDNADIERTILATLYKYGPMPKHALINAAYLSKPESYINVDAILDSLLKRKKVSLIANNYDVVLNI